jgi:hypothetical protein
MKIRFIVILLIQTYILNAQISNTLKKKVESIDKKYFTVILKSYDTKVYEELYTIYSDIAKTATNNELFYLALNGNTFIRHNAVSSLVYRNDKRIIELYKYYSEFPLEYEIKLSCVISKQDMALSNIRGSIFSRLKNYEDYKYLAKEHKNELVNFYTKEQINDYEKLDIQFLKNCITEFEKIDTIFIPSRLDTYKEINENWKDGKIQIFNY